MKCLNVVVFLMFSLIISAQKPPVKICEYKDTEISVKAQVDDYIFTYNSYVEIKLFYKNNTKKDIYIFDPAYYSSSFWNSEKFTYVFDVGGDFWTDLGVKQPIFLRKLSANKEIEIKMRLHLEAENITKMKYGIMETWYDSKLLHSAFLEFHIGYLLITPELNISQYAKKNPVVFNSDKLALLFEQKITRVFLGPLLLKISN